MQKKKYRFSSTSTTYYFNASFSYLKKLTDPAYTVIVTDRNVFDVHEEHFAGWKTIVLEPGEEHKVQATVDNLIKQLISQQADRRSFLVGVGGGVITDITGYAAAVYMRGIRFGFVPSSILAMVDASIGGQNGIDVGVYKNLVGTIRQPEFLLYDTDLLSSLPESEWVNGFAEIIKHACIKDAEMFKELEKNTVTIYRQNKKLLSNLIKANAVIKSEVVIGDEFEKAERRLLNFGHTWGHAVENKLALPHGHAVSIGMVMAAKISEKVTGFKGAARLISLLDRYGLPTSVKVDKEEIFQVLKMDKKREKSVMNYVLLNRIGKAVVKQIPVADLEKLIYSV
jgi:3-dehydroquinate synthase